MIKSKKNYQNINELQMPFLFFCASHYLFARPLRGVIKNSILRYMKLFSNDIDVVDHHWYLSYNFVLRFRTLMFQTATVAVTVLNKG